MLTSPYTLILLVVVLLAEASPVREAVVEVTVLAVGELETVEERSAPEVSFCRLAAGSSDDAISATFSGRVEAITFPLGHLTRGIAIAGGNWGSSVLANFLFS